MPSTSLLLKRIWSLWYPILFLDFYLDESADTSNYLNFLRNYVLGCCADPAVYPCFQSSTPSKRSRKVGQVHLYFHYISYSASSTSSVNAKRIWIADNQLEDCIIFLIWMIICFWAVPLVVEEYSCLPKLNLLYDKRWD